MKSCRCKPLIFFMVLVLAISVAIAGCAGGGQKPKEEATSQEAAKVSGEGDLAFFNGKIVTFIVCTKPGGGYDTYARLVAPYLQKYLPGSTVIVKNVPGAGHIVGANEIYTANPDGLTIGTFNPGLFYQQLVGAEGIKFDLAKFNWLARMAADARVLVVGAKTPYKDVNDLLTAKTPAKIGTTEVGGSDYTDAHILKEALGLKVDIVPGYQGKDNELAIMRGEIDAMVSSWSSARDFVNNGEGRVVLQVAVRQVPELANVPRALDVVKPEKKKLVDLITTVTELSRPIVAPPGLPPERQQALVGALQKALADQELLDKAKQSGLAIEPLFGDELNKMAQDALNQPPEIVDTLKRIFKPAS